ncbi:MAG: phosphatase PAP2 family protein [Polyangiaceae bacterium]
MNETDPEQKRAMSADSSCTLHRTLRDWGDLPQRHRPTYDEIAEEPRSNPRRELPLQALASIGTCRVLPLLGLALGLSYAGNAWGANDGIKSLRYDLTRDVSITASSAVLAVSLELASPSLAPARCRWCDRDSDGKNTLNGFDAEVRDALRWQDPTSAKTASNVFAFVLAPLAGAGVGAVIMAREDHTRNLPVDLLIVAQATMLSVNVGQGVKLALARERPDVHARSPEERAQRASTEDNLSFYSGHTSVAFAIAAASGTVASMRGYRLAPLVWATGETLAAVTGYFRIAADRHYASDVLVGAAMGSLIGFSVPYFLHRPTTETSSVAISASPGSGLMITGYW